MKAVINNNFNFNFGGNKADVAKDIIVKNNGDVIYDRKLKDLVTI